MFRKVLGFVGITVWVEEHSWLSAALYLGSYRVHTRRSFGLTLFWASSTTNSNPKAGCFSLLNMPSSRFAAIESVLGITILAKHVKVNRILFGPCGILYVAKCHYDNLRRDTNNAITILLSGSSSR